MERLLEQLRDDPLPPSAVDIDRALIDGRRRERYGRLATVVAAGCAVLAAAGGVTVALDRPAGRESRYPAAAPMPAEAPVTFDPMRRYAAFGWLPDGLTDTHARTGIDGLLVTASKQNASRSDIESSVELRVVTAGHDIALAATDGFVTQPGVTEGWAEVTPAEPVNGRPARWNDKARESGAAAALRWEYASGAWAEVIVRGHAAGADPRATARRIAASVRYGVDEQIRLPFTIAGGLPATLRPMSVATDSGSHWSVQVEYGDGKRTPYGDWPLTVMVIPRASRTGDGGGIADPDTTLDGHPARRTPMAGGGSGLQVYGVQGLYLELAAHDRTTDGQLPDGGLDGLFRAMSLYPDPRDWK